MPNDVVSHAPIDQICAGEEPDRRPRPRPVPRRDHGGADRGRSRTGAFLLIGPAGRRGRTVSAAGRPWRGRWRSLARPRPHNRGAHRPWSITARQPAAGPRPSTSSTTAATCGRPPAGCPVAKHGNPLGDPRSRAPADVLEALGGSTSTSTRRRSAAASTKIGLSASCSAQRQPLGDGPRRPRPRPRGLGCAHGIQLPLGPLTNPAGATRQPGSASPIATTRRRSPRR